jgi:hypothetical protein
MTPRTEKGAIEKLWRVKQYLRSTAAWDRNLSLEQIMGMQAAADLLSNLTLHRF